MCRHSGSSREGAKPRRGKGDRLVIVGTCSADTERQARAPEMAARRAGAAKRRHERGSVGCASSTISARHGTNAMRRRSTPATAARFRTGAWSGTLPGADATRLAPATAARFRSGRCRRGSVGIGARPRREPCQAHSPLCARRRAMVKPSLPHHGPSTVGTNDGTDRSTLPIHGRRHIGQPTNRPAAFLDEGRRFSAYRPPVAFVGRRVLPV